MTILVHTVVFEDYCKWHDLANALALAAMTRVLLN